MNRWVKAGILIVALFVIVSCLGVVMIASLVSNYSSTCEDTGSGEDAVVVKAPNGVTLSSFGLTVKGAPMKSDQAKVAAHVAGVVDAQAKKRRFTSRQHQRAVVIALITGAVESELRNVPYGHLDSLGVFQQRPSMGWGTVAQVMDVTYATNKFLSVLFTLKGWDTMNQGDAAQRVQRSGFPDRYQERINEAERIYSKMRFPGKVNEFVSVADLECEPGVDSGSEESIIATGKWTNPLKSSYRNAHNYGPRIHPITRARGFHNGNDLGSSSGTSIYAASSGKIVFSTYSGAWGNVVVINHGKYFTLYAHMSNIDGSARIGSTVHGGQRIGVVGSTGLSTAPHLHLSVCTSLSLCLAGSGAQGKGSVDPDSFFEAQGVKL